MIVTTDTLRWTPTPDLLRIRRLRQRYGLSEPAARLLAPFIFGEALQ